MIIAVDAGDDEHRATVRSGVRGDGEVCHRLAQEAKGSTHLSVAHYEQDGQSLGRVAPRQSYSSACTTVWFESLRHDSAHPALGSGEWPWVTSSLAMRWTLDRHRQLARSCPRNMSTYLGGHCVEFDDDGWQAMEWAVARAAGVA